MNIKKVLKRCEWCNSENGDRSSCPLNYACEDLNWIDALKRLNEADQRIKELRKNGIKGILNIPELEIQDETEPDFPF